jgi:hypothetical protein
VGATDSGRHAPSTSVALQNDTACTEEEEGKEVMCGKKNTKPLDK